MSLMKQCSPPFSHGQDAVNHNLVSNPLWGQPMTRRCQTDSSQCNLSLRSHRGDHDIDFSNPRKVQDSTIALRSFTRGAGKKADGCRTEIWQEQKGNQPLLQAPRSRRVGLVSRTCDPCSVRQVLAPSSLASGLFFKFSLQLLLHCRHRSFSTPGHGLKQLG